MNQIKANHYRCESREALQAAKELVEFYSNKRMILTESDVARMMVDVYKDTKIQFRPTREDVLSYMKVLDCNQDGKVTLTDIASLAVKYLCGNQDNISTEEVKKSFGATTTHSEQTTPSRSMLGARTSKIRKFSPLKISHKQVIEIFQRFQDPKQNKVTRMYAGSLLAQSMKLMGKVGYYPSRHDVSEWVSLCDSDQDGKITIQDFMSFVEVCCERDGIVLVNT